MVPADRVFVFWVLAFVSIACPLGSFGIEPRELALLVNGRSRGSMEIANRYVALRNIPDSNVVHLQLPDSVLAAEAQISVKDFMAHVWQPTHETLRARGIHDQVLAWVYSTDFPIVVTSSPRVSILGMTFMRGALPSKALIKEGRYLSPLFAGPDNPEGPMTGSHTLRQFKAQLGDRMPLPCMMLGFAGARGNTLKTITRTLERGASSDGTKPHGNRFFCEKRRCPIPLQRLAVH